MNDVHLFLAASLVLSLAYLFWRAFWGSRKPAEKTPNTKEEPPLFIGSTRTCPVEVQIELDKKFDNLRNRVSQRTSNNDVRMYVMDEAYRQIDWENTPGIKGLYIPLRLPAPYVTYDEETSILKGTTLKELIDRKISNIRRGGHGSYSAPEGTNSKTKGPPPTPIPKNR